MTTIMTAPVISRSLSRLWLTAPEKSSPHVNSMRGEPLITRSLPWSGSMQHRPTFAAASGVWNPHITEREFAVQFTDSKPAKLRRPAMRSSSAHALAMLTRQPVYSAPVPQFHIEARVVDATLFVGDRASGDRFQVYTPRFVSQFRAGHRAGLWYVRRTTDVEITPRGPGFATASDAVESLRAGSWSGSAPALDRRRESYRVFWA
jgi:hypothetical protein